MNREQLTAAIGKRIRAVRHEHEMSQEELCNRVGLHQPDLSEIENGNRLPNIWTLHELCKATGETLSFFFEEINE